MGRLLLGTAVLIALLTGYFCLRPNAPRHGVPPLDGKAVAEVAAADRLKPGLHPTTNAVAGFKGWAERYVAGDKEAEVEEGEKLARARLAEMYELIKRDPKAALEQAIPYEQRKRLPESVAALLEERVAGHGDYQVLAAMSPSGEPKPTKPVRRYAVLNGKFYDAHVYGRRKHQVTRENIPLHGVAVGNALALHDEPARVLSKEEAIDVIAAGGAQAEAVCSVSGESTTVVAQQTIVQLGDKYLNLCRPSHARQLNTWLMGSENEFRTSIRASGDFGRTNLPPEPFSNTQGRFTLLFLRLRFLDDPLEPVSEAQANVVMNGANQFFVDASYNTASIISTIAPLVTLPFPKEWYSYTGPGAVLAHARQVARDMGYDYLDYDLDIVAHRRVPGDEFDWGGLAFVGGRGNWLQSIGTGVACHELGHNFGLLHANFLDQRPDMGVEDWPPPNPNDPRPNFPIDSDSVVGHDGINVPGFDEDYGDPFDTMGNRGGAGIFHYDAVKKAQLRWLPISFVQGLGGSSTNRVFAYDARDLTEGRTYALVARKDYERIYWFAHRQLIVSNPWMVNGVEVHYQPYGGGAGLYMGTEGSAQLIDTTPGTPAGRNDAAIVVGRTFSDWEANLHVTPIGRGEDGTDKWIDVVTHQGVFPENVPPTLNLSASSLVVSPGEDVTFTATATDANGDLLAYYWDFSNGTFGTNAPVFTRSFATDGYYVVRCEVSDMKGGVMSAHLMITVGAPTTFTMSGQVIDSFANPLANVRVHNGRLGAEYRTTFTDSQGYYTMTDVAPGNYTNRAFLFHYKTGPLAFFNPVSIAGGNGIGLDHLANPINKVSIALVSDGNETGTPITFSVSRTGDPSADLWVPFVLSGSAVPNADYEAPAENAVIIPAGETSTLLSFNAIPDGRSDGTRLLQVSLRLDTNDIRVLTMVTNINGTNEVIYLTNTVTYRGWELITENNQDVWYQTYPKYVLGTAEGLARIFDADPPAPPSVSLVMLDDAAVETGRDYAMLVLGKEGNLDRETVVRYSVSGTASNGLDYVFLPGTVTIPVGAAQVAFPIEALDDLFVEGNESLTVSLVNDAGYTVGNRSQTVYIVENDLPLITINATDGFAYEPTTQSPGRFTITRSGNVSQPLTVYYLLAGSAINGIDYVALPGDVTIPAGQHSVNVLVTPRADSLVETNETVLLLLSDHTTYNIGPPNTATVIIQDESIPVVALQASDTAADEGGGNSGQFTFTRSGPMANNLIVNFEVGGTAVPQADYSAIGNNILLPANTPTTTLNINALNDDFRETNETVILKLLPSPNYHIGSPDGGEVTISFNDDSELPEISFAARTSSAVESQGQALLSVRLSASIGSTNRAPAQVEWRISGGSATFDVDYSLLATGLVTFDFDTPIYQDLAVPLNNDAVRENTETLLLTLFHPFYLITNTVVTTNSTNMVISPAPTNAHLGSYRTHTLSILDDDSAVVSITAPDIVAYEAGRDPAVIVIAREGSTNSAQSVMLAIAGTAAGGNDYVALPRTVVIPPGSYSVTIPVVPFDDPEEEVVETVAITVVRAPGADIGSDSVELRIIDNDGTIQFAAPEVHARESLGVGFVGVVRTGDTNLAASVQYVIQEGTATLDRDFFATNGVLNFAPGEVTKNIAIFLQDDRTVEEDETVFLYLTNASGGVPLGGQTACTFFIDNDDTSVQFVSSFFTASENGGTGALQVVRLGLLNYTSTVEVVTVDGTATNGLDYTGVTNLVSFGLGETSKVVNVPIRDDFLFEGNEFLIAFMRNPSTNSILAGTNASLVILDDECALAFAETSFATNEYQQHVRVIVSRLGGTVNPVSVDYATFDGTASNGVDYVSATGTLDFLGDRWLLASDGSGRLEFHPGESQKVLLVGFMDDTLGEGDERFQVRLSNARPISGPANSVVLGNGAPTNAAVVILDNETPGNVDYEHDPGAGANNRVLAVALQPPDSKVVFGGQFNSVDGIGFSRIARLNFDGSLDTTFNPGSGSNQDVQAIATQPDGKILIGGAFSLVDNVSRTRIARLNANGSLDPGFAPFGVNSLVRAIAVQPDGRVLIAGDFTQVNGFFRQRLARLNADGSLDTPFQATINGPVHAIAVQDNGRIIVGGSFTTVGGLIRRSIARLNPNGSVDATFDPGSGANAAVNAVAVQTDGKVVLGGAFTGIDGIIRNRIARLTEVGTVDGSFDPGTGANGNVNALAINSTGRINLGGEFTNIDGYFLNRFARLRADGKVDTQFDPGTGADGVVRALVLQSDTAMIIGGDFTVIDSIPRNRIARIHGDEKSNVVGVEFLSSTPSVIENGGQAAITVLRSGNTNVAFSVQLIATNGTATAGVDYVPTNATLNFARGELSKSVNVRVLDDSLVETDEFVDLVLTNGSANVDLTTTAPGSLRIIDNEQSFRFATNDFVAAENDGVALVTVLREGFRAGTVTVEFRTMDDTARAPGDYMATNRTLTFTNGEAAKLVPVLLTDDRQEEPTETAQLVLVNPTGAFLGNPANATLTITDTDITYGVWDFVFSNRIDIVDGTPALPYPATINVSGLSGVVGRVEVTLSNLAHTFPDDIDILLVAPNGRSVVVMSDAGGSADVVNLTLRFSDLAAAALPNSTALTSGTNQPTDFESGETFPSPAPLGPYGSALNWLNGGNPNGDWKLFVRDDRGSDTGQILNGWQLHITTVNPETITDLAIGIQDSPDPLQAGQTLTYILSLTNLGPRLATNVLVLNMLPPDVEFMSAIPSQGTCVQSNATVACDLGGVDVGGLGQITITVRPLVGASMTNTASVIAVGQNDIVVPNSAAVAVTSVNTAPVSDFVMFMTDAPDPLFAGQDLTYAVNITNKGPLTATGVVFTDVLPPNVNFVSATTSQGQCGLANGRVTCNLGVMSVGSAASISVVVRPMVNGKIVNLASMSANEPDLTPAEVSVESTVYPSADLAVFQTDSRDPFPLGGILTYTVTVSNLGPNVAHGVNIVNTLPANAPLLGVLASQGSCYLIGSLLICDFGVLTNGGAASVNIDVRPDTQGLVQNSATVLAGDFDTVSVNNTWTETTVVSSFGSGLVITPNTNAVELAAAVTAAGSAGIRVTSARLSAHQALDATSSGTFSIGSPPFTYNLTRPGIVLSSGNVMDYESGPNQATGNTFAYGRPATANQETLLDPITGVGTNNFRHFDATQLDIVFDLLPGFDRVEFKVVFGSEEYSEFVGSSFIDGFGLYLNGSNIAFTAGSPVNINHREMRALPGTELDGVLAPAGDPILTFSAALPAGSVSNVLTIIVSDTSDTVLDTTVYVSSLQGAEAPNADLAASIVSSPEPVVIGSPLTYTMTAVNRGPDIATNVLLVSQVPQGMGVVGLSASQGFCFINGGNVNCFLNNLARGSNATVQLTVIPPFEGRVTNAVDVSSDLADLIDTNNTARVISTVVEPGAFFNTSPIFIADAAPGVAYPSVINVSGMNGAVSRVTVTLSELNHSFPGDIDVLLVSPSGQKAVLLSDVGEGADINSVTLKFDDAAGSFLPGLGPLISGTFKPTNVGDDETFYSPAPAGPYASALSAFVGDTPNGPWSLYVMDDQGADSGSMAAGWRLTIFTGAEPPAPAVEIVLDGAEVIISWPDPSPGYVLESSDAPGSGATWVVVPNAPGSVGGRWRVTLPAGAGNQFFRLRKGTSP